MELRYWLVHANGGRQLIDPEIFDLGDLAERVKPFGCRLEVESAPGATSDEEPNAVAATFEPPISALGPIFRSRLERIHTCRTPYLLELVTRPTGRSLGGYYKSSHLIRLFTHDRTTGRRPFGELFGTFLHEMAHHLEHTEYDSFDARSSGRKKGVMHSKLFWRILGELNGRWAELEAG